MEDPLGKVRFQRLLHRSWWGLLVDVEVPMTRGVFRFCNGAYPYLGTVAIAVAVVVYLDMLDIAESGVDIAFYTVFIACAVTLIARAYVWAAIVAGPLGVEVRNPLRTRRYTWAEVKGFRAEDRVVIVLRDGAEVRCWAVQRAHIARLLRRHSYVDDVVADLTRLQEEYRADGQ
ncbi:PH domain-containing protein [Streptomyces sp. S1]|uniref:PH domain-containing protein n=1 Tax=Streptomyces sp. S1 TaxID=718288 RepID=UPI003D75B75C